MIIGRFDAAQVEFEQAIRYKPDSAEIALQPRQALFRFRTTGSRRGRRSNPRFGSIRRTSRRSTAWASRWKRSGDDAGAIAKYEKAIELNAARGGSFSSAHVNLSAYYNRTGDPDKALEHARKAIELDPKSDRAWFQKGRAGRAPGSLDAAVDALNRRSPSTRGPPRITTSWPVSTGVSGGPTKAGRRWRCSSASSRKAASWRRSGAAALACVETLRRPGRERE